MYWDDNKGNCFKYIFGTTNYGQIYWFGWHRAGRRKASGHLICPLGALYPYLNGSDVRLCPALDYALAQFKLKGDGMVFSYGYNFYLSTAQPAAGERDAKSRTRREPRSSPTPPRSTIFRHPASPSNPMLEEWYYLDLETNYSEHEQLSQRPFPP